ncbi:MAG TPA: UPF0182 family protein [Virgibacillus sp.]|nr:UPF0182 family protein [Virgibacillus sp.]
MDFNQSFNKEQIEKAKKIMKRIGYVVLFILLVILLVLFSFQYLTEYVWMGSLGFSGVFTTVLWSKVILAVIGFLLFAIITFATAYWIRRSYLSHFAPVQLPKMILNKKQMMWVMVGISVLIGLFGSSIVQGLGWERMLKFIHHANFDISDPYFNLDVSFYIFILPFMKLIINILLGAAILFFLIEAGAYSVFNMWRMNRSAQLHMGVTLGIIGLLLAALHVLAPFDTLLTNRVSAFQESVVYGLSYTDKVINIPKSYILAGVAVLGSIWMIISLVRGRLKAMAIPAIVYVGLLIVGQGASIIVQNFVVSPNEFSKEEPYLEHNLEFTKEAYKLSEIDEKDHPGNDSSFDKDMVERNQETIDNIRVNDSRPLLEVYNQKQTFRTYYDFKDVDIDRYQIDDKYEQVFIGTRELSMDDLPDQAQTWVNRYLRYTHGYGVTMSHVNDVTSQGQPEYMLNNIPPEGKLDVSRPQVYFGEEDYPNVIVNSKVDEFDYPSGDENASTRFEADSGIPLVGWKKLLFALNEGSFRMLVSDQLTDESQLLDTRNIMDRVNRIAPFFTYDDDPYIFIREDGTMAWMLDAYLSAERYPYSEPHEKEENYIRNSVKVVVDAYTGETTFYVADDDDPLLQTYQKMFPDLFTTDVPDDIKSHFRYPVNMFEIQAEMYGTYHMSNLEVFYNREDFWEFPTEKYFDEDIEMEPYYITMRLPDHDEEEFILMQPYTPKKRQNMISWIGVRNDGDHYGEMFLYRFPKQKNIYGPQQIENRINQSDTISQQLNLWSQGGSKVIRGNLLAIPIEDTVFYVEPVYLESSNQTSLPEVKRIILAYGERIVMEPTFEEALDEMLDLLEEKGAGDPPDDAELGDDDTDSNDDGNVSDDEGLEEDENEEQDDTNEDQNDTNDEIDDVPDDDLIDSEEQLRDFAELFDDYQDAISNGNWEKAGKLMEEIEEKLDAYK